MALKFLNKKGWHTGSLRNIENVWKAEQKHESEQKKLEELRKQIQEERERSEFRLLQEQAGLVPKQERLDFLYESGLAVGKGSSDGFKALDAPPKADAAAAESSASKAAAPGALFEDKPQSANDAWRKLHSDPLLLIRQREQEALVRIKNNPIKMAMIRKSVEAEKHKKQDKKEKRGKKEHKKKHHHSKSKQDNHSSKVHSDSEDTIEKEDRRKGDRREHHSKLKQDNRSSKVHSDSEDTIEKEDRRKGDRPEHREYSNLKHERHSIKVRTDRNNTSEGEEKRRKSDPSTSERHRPGPDIKLESKARETHLQALRQGSGYNRHWGAPKLSEEEKAARIREMQLDAELHEEQRWKRLKKASEDDAREAIRASSSSGKNFLDAAQRSIYGAEKGGSSTIEESVRRRTYYLQGSSASHEGNAFRR